MLPIAAQLISSVLPDFHFAVCTESQVWRAAPRHHPAAMEVRNALEPSCNAKADHSPDWFTSCAKP